MSTETPKWPLYRMVETVDESDFGDFVTFTIETRHNETRYAEIRRISRKSLMREESVADWVREDMFEQLRRNIDGPPPGNVIWLIEDILRGLRSGHVPDEYCDYIERKLRS